MSYSGCQSPEYHHISEFGIAEDRFVRYEGDCYILTKGGLTVIPVIF